jgi:hypothetical protein
MFARKYTVRIQHAIGIFFTEAIRQQTPETTARAAAD